jgi:hypothetical protein
MMNNAAITVTILAGFNGAGRLLDNPFWKPDTAVKMVYQNHLTFASQLLNVYGMWVVKLSICAYLLVLNFSRRYRWVVWVSHTSSLVEYGHLLTGQLIRELSYSPQSSISYFL